MKAVGRNYRELAGRVRGKVKVWCMSRRGGMHFTRAFTGQRAAQV